MNNAPSCALLLVLLCSPVFSQAPAPAATASQAGSQQPEFIQKGNQLARDGKLQEAVDLFQTHLDVPGDALAANIAIGSTLDLMGQGHNARVHFAKALELASTLQQKAQVNRATAMSYAFEGDCKHSVEYQQKVFDFQKEQRDYFAQGEVANEVARVCIDSGDLNTAYEWYKTGHDVGLQESNIKPDRVDLWNFRWEHAQARVAARKGNKSEAEKHVAAAKAILDKGTNPNQAPFFPYLVGYVALYTGDPNTALNEFQRGNQNDPFIQTLIGETYEKLGNKEKATEFYRKAASTIAHNPAGAYAKRITRAKGIS
jgi:tetratricopeptide (TPR) repeat protein